MTQSNTPGPWRIDYQQGEAPYIVAEQGKAWNNPTICQLYQDVTPEDSVTIGPWLETFDNATANARLIAAAPELLSVARKLLTVAEGWPMTIAYRSQLIEEAEAVIAKATGEERKEA